MKKLISISIFVILASFLCGQTMAEVPHMINYQGKLTDANGNLIPGTVTKSITFTIYDSTGGNILWTDTLNVELTHGVFSVLLGEEKPITDPVFNGEVRYLGVKVGTDPEMSPRKKIGSVGYAFRSGWADTARVCIIEADNDWNYWSNPPHMHSISTGNVGIGTTSPTYKLDVSGDIRATGTIFGTVDNADKVDLIHASTTPTANYLYPLDANTKIPNARLYTGTGNGLDADMVDGNHYNSNWPTTLGNIQSACSNDFHNIGGTDDDVPDNDAEVPDNISVDNGRLYAPSGSGNVGIGTTSPTVDLEVADDAKVGDYLRVGGELYIYESGVPLAGWKLYVNGGVKITDSLQVLGTIKLTYDYNSGWVHIDPGQTITLYHNLLRDEGNYIVDLYGKSSDGKIHQANYGTNSVYYVTKPRTWWGCEWFGLTNSQIKVTRGEDDDDGAPERDWYYFRVRILKNQ